MEGRQGEGQGLSWNKPSGQASARCPRMRWVSWRLRLGHSWLARVVEVPGKGCALRATGGQRVWRAAAPATVWHPCSSGPGMVV